MWNNVIGGHIRSANRKLLLANVALIICLCIVTLVCGRYFYNFFLGPFPMEKKVLQSLKGPNDTFDYYVTVNGKMHPEPFARQMSVNKKTKAETLVAEYVKVATNDRLLVVKVPNKAVTSQTTFTGALVEMPADIRAELQKDLANARFPMDEVLVPAMLDTTGFRAAGWIGLGIGVPLYILGIVNIARALRRMGRVERHPIAKSLQRFGTPEQVAQDIDKELTEGQLRLRSGQVTLAPTWLLRPTTFGMQIVHVAELVWVYKKVTKHSTNGIPTGTTYAAVIHTRNGSSMEVGGVEGRMEDLLGSLCRRAPWVLAGFDQQIANMWKSNRGGVIAAVDERRRRILSDDEEEIPEVQPSDDQTPPDNSFRVGNN